MKIRFECPGCNKWISGSKKHVGRLVTCPECKTQFKAVLVGSSSPPALPADPQKTI